MTGDLERALRELEVDWPPTPDIAGAVHARLDAPPRRRRSWRAWLIGVLVVLVGGTLAVEPARSAVFRWLGIGGVEIRHEAPPATRVRPSALGESLGLGSPVSLAEARRRAPALVPGGLGAPGAVYLGRLQDGTPAVSLVYRPQSGLRASRETGVALLVQTLPAKVTPFIEKTIGSSGRVERLTVGGARAYWLTQSHGFMYAGRGGGGFERRRVADRTLLVERDGLVLRIEGPLTRERAVAIAEDALS